MPNRRKLKKEIKQLDKVISFYIDKSDKSKEEIAYLHSLLHKRHDKMLQHFYAKEDHLQFIPKGQKVVDIIFDTTLMDNEYVTSVDDSAPDAVIILEDCYGTRSAIVHELKCGRSKRMVNKGLNQLEKYAREVYKSFDNVIFLLTFGKRTKQVSLDISVPFYNLDPFGKTEVGEI